MRKRALLSCCILILAGCREQQKQPVAEESAANLLQSRIKEEKEVVFIPWNGKLPEDGSNCYLRFKQESEVRLDFMGYGGDIHAGHFSFITGGSIEAILKRGNSYINWPRMALRRDGDDLLLYREDGKTWWHDLYPPPGKTAERDTWPFQPEYIDSFWPLRAIKKNRSEQDGNLK